MASRTFLAIAKLKAFPIFPSGMRHMPGNIRDKTTIFQKRNQLQTGLASEMTCFPKQKKGKEKYLFVVGNQKE
ncbi:hypothetical protein DVH24_033549 [Malus domestica]|uniref:Uncharacterized protein n=1 Tax=Malus domestica TaxID=3750 RepID=A0A498JFN9_MALDO|nr:hypothetical protein DVH24_033549 [Malus domestica]